MAAIQPLAEPYQVLQGTQQAARPARQAEQAFRRDAQVLQVFYRTIAIQIDSDVRKRLIARRFPWKDKGVDETEWIQQPLAHHLVPRLPGHIFDNPYRQQVVCVRV